MRKICLCIILSGLFCCCNSSQRTTAPLEKKDKRVFVPDTMCPQPKMDHKMIMINPVPVRNSPI